MNDPDESTARTRYFIMSLVRLAGVAILMLGILVTQGIVPWPPVAGYVLIGVGLLDIFVMPALLARKWRRPDR